MSHTSRLDAETSDADLIDRVRSGDLDAYGDLFARHREAATRLARHLAPGPDADDLVAEGFSRVLTALQNGNGPEEFFRAYLLTSIRRLHVDRLRAAKRVKTTADEAELDRAIAFVDPAEMRFEQSTAAAAFASLPERWQLVLWHLDVEGQKPAQVAPLLGMSPNSVSALAYRAREGLRTAYLQGHLAPPLDDGCRRTTPLLAQHVRDNLSKREAAQVDEHLDSCARCSGLYAELSEVNHHLAGLLAPAVLGVATAGYLGSSGSVAAAGFFAPVAHLAEAVGRSWRSATARTSSGVSSGVVVAAVSAVVIASGAVAVTQLSGRDTADTTRSAEAPAPAPVPTAAPPARPAPQESPSSLRPVEPVAPIVTEAPPAVVPTAPAEPAATQAPVAETTTAPSKSIPMVRPTPMPAQLPERTPVPSTPVPSTPGPTATDYTASVVFVSEPAEYLVRRVNVAITTAGEEPRGNLLTVTMSFNALQGGVEFRGAQIGDWSCDAPATGGALTTMTCTREQTGAAVPPIVFSVHGRYPGASVGITAAGNDRGTTRGTTGRACDYLDPDDCPAY